MNANEFQNICYLKMWTASQIKAELDEVHGASTPLLKTISGYISLKIWPNEHWRWSMLWTPEIMKKIRTIIIKDHRVKVCEIQEAVSISTERVHNILHQKLHTKKICVQWVLHLLIKNACIRTLQHSICQCLTAIHWPFCADSWLDETWIY